MLRTMLIHEEQPHVIDTLFVCETTLSTHEPQIDAQLHSAIVFRPRVVKRGNLFASELICDAVVMRKLERNCRI